MILHVENSARALELFHSLFQMGFFTELSSGSTLLNCSTHYSKSVHLPCLSTVLTLLIDSLQNMPLTVPIGRQDMTNLKFGLCMCSACIPRWYVDRLTGPSSGPKT